MNLFLDCLFEESRSFLVSKGWLTFRQFQWQRWSTKLNEHHHSETAHGNLKNRTEPAENRSPR